VLMTVPLAVPFANTMFLLPINKIVPKRSTAE
jgi:hypothetical protein